MLHDTIQVSCKFLKVPVQSYLIVIMQLRFPQLLVDYTFSYPPPPLSLFDESTCNFLAIILVIIFPNNISNLDMNLHVFKKNTQTSPEKKT